MISLVSKHHLGKQLEPLVRPLLHNLRRLIYTREGDNFLLRYWW